MQWRNGCKRSIDTCGRKGQADSAGIGWRKRESYDLCRWHKWVVQVVQRITSKGVSKIRCNIKLRAQPGLLAMPTLLLTRQLKDTEKNWTEIWKNDQSKTKVNQRLSLQRLGMEKGKDSNAEGWKGARTRSHGVTRFRVDLLAKLHPELDQQFKSKGFNSTQSITQFQQFSKYSSKIYYCTTVTKSYLQIWSSKEAQKAAFTVYLLQHIHTWTHAEP